MTLETLWVSLEAFKKEFNPAAMTAAKIYPTVIWEREKEEALDYLTDYFQKVVVFYREAVARGDGVVLWIG